MKYSKADNSIFNFTAVEFIFCGCFVIIKKRMQGPFALKLQKSNQNQEVIMKRSKILMVLLVGIMLLATTATAFAATVQEQGHLALGRQGRFRFVEEEEAVCFKVFVYNSKKPLTVGFFMQV